MEMKIEQNSKYYEPPIKLFHLENSKFVSLSVVVVVATSE